MSVASIALILVSVTLSAVAQVAFKLGVASKPPAMAGSLLGPFAIFVIPGVATGLILYAFGTLLWLHALKSVNLSQAYPFVGIGFAMTTLAGWYLFAEALSLGRLVGIGAVIGGIVLLARS